MYEAIRVLREEVTAERAHADRLHTAGGAANRSQAELHGRHATGLTHAINILLDALPRATDVDAPGLTVHLDLPTDNAADAWLVMAMCAAVVEGHFELEVDADDMHVTHTADWTLPVPDDSAEFVPRPIDTVPMKGDHL